MASVALWGATCQGCCCTTWTVAVGWQERTRGAAQWRKASVLSAELLGLMHGSVWCLEHGRALQPWLVQGGPTVARRQLGVHTDGAVRLLQLVTVVKQDAVSGGTPHASGQI